MAIRPEPAEPTGTDIIPQNLDGLPVPIRASDGYVNITAFLAAASKRLGKLKKWSHYDESDAKQEFMAALARRLGMRVKGETLEDGMPSLRASNDFALFFSTKGGKHAGTWVHPVLAVDIAGWVDPELEVTMKTWCHRWMTQGEEPADPGAAPRASHSRGFLPQ